MKKRNVEFGDLAGIAGEAKPFLCSVALSRKQRAERLAIAVGAWIAWGALEAPDGRSVEQMAKLAVSRFVGDFDPGFRANLGLAARNKFNEINPDL